MPRILPAGWDTHIHVFDAQAPVQPGHYQPAHQPLERIESQALQWGVGHLVLVQPSVYGTDNSLVLQALGREPGRHRAVVVVDAAASDDELQAMHALGVRGVRFNLVSPVGNGADAFAVLAPRLKALGWHVQWYAKPHQLAQIAHLHAQSGVTCVLDHLAGMHAGLGSADPAWSALQELSDLGAWVKLSGWYRLQSTAPYDDLLSHIQRICALQSGRVVWGSDWPHTAFDANAMPPYESVWMPVVNALGPAGAGDVLAAGAALYG